MLEISAENMYLRKCLFIIAFAVTSIAKSAYARKSLCQLLFLNVNECKELLTTLTIQNLMNQSVLLKDDSHTQVERFRSSAATTRLLGFKQINKK